MPSYGMKEERLQKLIAAAGIASRRHAEELIKARKVTVNGAVVTELGTKANPETDHIKVNGRLINRLLKPQEKMYVLLNKPKGYLSSLSDPKGRPLVTQLVPSSLGRLHPVGRLDFNTEGLLLLTNDGDFTNHVTSARNGIPKVYRVKVKGIPTDNAIERLRRGVRLDDGVRTAPAEILPLEQTGVNAWFEMTLHEGLNQQIRRMFDAIGHSVLKLSRERIGALTDPRMKPGEWRQLSPAEVKRFYRPSRERPSRERPSRERPSRESSRQTKRPRRRLRVSSR